jgi:cytochrome c-type biogenesis protein CcmF
MLALVSATAGVLIGYWRPFAWRVLRWLQIFSAVCALGAFTTLTLAVITGNVQVAYAVTNHAAANQPLWYRMAAVWAGQEGGLLLWAVEISLIALAISPKTQPRATTILLTVQGSLLAMVALNAPFASPHGQTGDGLNPLLMHPMMLIHPPMLFLGYALLAVPYAITLGALLDRTPDVWPQRVRPWLLLAWLALTAGNGFGAAWAYKTFGWGGFWSWDPVENTSFVPWVCIAAAVHGLWMTQHDGRWVRWATINTLLAFITVLYGSFLARSGVLANASVHAYAGGKTLFLWTIGGLLIASGLTAIIMLTIRWHGWRYLTPKTSRGLSAPAWGIGLLMAVAIIVLAGMSLPMMGLNPVPELYNAVLLPFATAIVSCFVVSPLVQRGYTVRHRRLVLLAMLLLIIPSALFVWAGTPHDLGVMGVSYRIFGTLLLSCCVVASAQLVYQCYSRRLEGPPVAVMAHAGVILLLGGTLISGYGTRTDRSYVMTGQQVSIAGQTITLTKIHQPSPAITTAQLIINDYPTQVAVEHDPKFRIDLRQVAITHRFLGDVYVTPLAIVVTPESRQKPTVSTGVMLEVSRKPGIRMVWLGLWLIALSLLLALVRLLYTGGSDTRVTPFQHTSHFTRNQKSVVNRKEVRHRYHVTILPLSIPLYRFTDHGLFRSSDRHDNVYLTGKMSYHCCAFPP